MDELISLLKMLYACNAMAQQSPPSLEKAVFCVDIYDQAKLQFLTRSELDQIQRVPLKQQNEITLRGYERFKQWEAENPELVKELRLQCFWNKRLANLA